MEMFESLEGRRMFSDVSGGTCPPPHKLPVVPPPGPEASRTPPNQRKYDGDHTNAKATDLHALPERKPVEFKPRAKIALKPK